MAATDQSGKLRVILSQTVSIESDIADAFFTDEPSPEFDVVAGSSADRTTFIHNVSLPRICTGKCL